MKKRFFTNSILGVAVAAATTISCKRDNEMLQHNTSALHIAQSERLTIPVDVDLPANLPYGNTRVLTLYAEGVQQYKAQVKAGSYPITYEWVFVAPKAVLYDASNQRIGTHGAGPYWALSATDSIFAQQFTPAKTATPDNSSIPWLQLMPKAGKIPTGIFTNVAYIQRIATVGGKAPAALPTSFADTVDVPYTAIYRFTKKNA